MNFRVVFKLIGRILLLLAGSMVLPLLVALLYGESPAPFLYSILLLGVIGGGLSALPATSRFYAREGFFAVALIWLLTGVAGSLPFLFSGWFATPIDCIFESCSGFTTTGATILTEIEPLPKGILFWRSFTHWLGGMGVLVLLLAIIPAGGRGRGYTMHILRAESPGPNVGKLVPKMKDTAKILYLIYILLTVLNVVFLLIGKMPVFDAVCTAFGTAGTGGFGIRNDSIAGYSPYLQNVCTVFMLLFGVNFSCYYLLLMRKIKNVFRDEELRMYMGAVIGSIVLIVWNLKGFYGTLGETVRHAAFQVASIMTTTGFATTDFDLWPSFSKAVLLALMVVGACAGSTGGGLKCGRALLLLKSLRRNIRKVLHPQKVQIVRNNGQMVDEKVLENTNAYLAAYVVIVLLSFIVISLDGFSITTNISAVLACFNNIGPGFDAVGPTCNFAAYSPLSKVVLIADMLAGRLEIFPILILFSRSTWSHR